APAGSGDLVLVDQRLHTVYRVAEQAAQTSASVLITGETGVGKDVLARWIHDRSPRKEAPFVHVDLAAIQGNLLESELFGHAKGSFTGATEHHAGLLESGHG